MLKVRERRAFELDIFVCYNEEYPQGEVAVSQFVASIVLYYYPARLNMSNL